MLTRLATLAGLPKDKFLKPLPAVTFEEAERLYKDTPERVYFFKRQNPKMPPLLFVENGQNPHIEPKPEPDAVVRRLREQAQRHLRQRLAAGQVIQPHQVDRARPEHASTVEFAAAPQHLAEA